MDGIFFPACKKDESIFASQAFGLKRCYDWKFQGGQLGVYLYIAT